MAQYSTTIHFIDTLRSKKTKAAILYSQCRTSITGVYDFGAHIEISIILTTGTNNTEV